ncbi:reverse transcriptase domain-containing protein [Aeromonas rivipollensis]|uniref:RNA-dependent DNA polymerase n=1 Tax=Aeromonas rivipollensis TaxID=948519 RepID=A0AAW9YEP3_9GAMM|nr:reverse transcriptase domain-containing protein [Aeromonas rivipollensis]NEX76247.1 RNA-dependent DNA polymerase [Aeromonas rivipollensis]
MRVQDRFNQEFAQENLKEIFSNHIVYSGATGIDNMNQYAFRKQLDSQVEIISRKMIDGTYTFSKYKLKLLTKGRNKAPREISIPTVRDRIALRAMCNFLQCRFADSVKFTLPQDVIKDVKAHALSGKFDSYIKLDVSNFYPSIKHNILRSQLWKRIRQPHILDIIFSAVTAPSVLLSRKDDKPTEVGVPQGLAVSNILAAIYLQNIDKFLSQLPNVKCYRYVDDVLILCSAEQAHDLAQVVIKKFRDIGLKIHCPVKIPEKSKIDSLSNGFDYLGYQFSNEHISARNGSIEKLKASLAGIFTSYKHSQNKSLKILEWRLNLRITGCVFEKKCKGWQFFFSEINDEDLLHRLDHYVLSLCKRFKVEINPKKFVRTFKEISHNKYNTTYVPNFDQYDLAKMKIVLVQYFNFDIKTMTDEEVRYHFNKKIGSQVKELEIDVKDFGY